jgi:hypothetical protein
MMSTSFCPRSYNYLSDDHESQCFTCFRTLIVGLVPLSYIFGHVNVGLSALGQQEMRDQNLSEFLSHSSHLMLITLPNTFHSVV